MATTTKNLVASQQLTNAAVTYYTTPANTRTTIDKATVTNTTTTARTVTVYLIASGGSAGDSNTLTKTKTVPPNSVLDLTEMVLHTMETGGFIQALADANSAVTFRVSGREVTM